MLIVTSGSCEIQRSVFIDIKLSAIAIVPILTLRHVARRTSRVDIPFQIYGDVCTKSHIRKSRSFDLFGIGTILLTYLVRRQSIMIQPIASSD